MWLVGNEVEKNKIKNESGSRTCCINTECLPRSVFAVSPLVKHGVDLKAVFIVHQ